MGMVATVDLPLDDNIHIASEGFAVLGRRLAREARRLVLGERGIRPPPRLKSISLAYMPKASANPKGGGSLVVDVAFDPASQPLRSDGQPRGFAIADAEGNNTHTIHKTTLHGNIVRLHLTAYEPSHFLHYGYGRVPACTLTDAAGHSLPVFGPRLLGQPHRFLPFVKTWSVHAPIRTEIPLDGFKAPPADLPEAEVKTYGENVFKLEGFINEHSNWSNRSGLAFFSASLEVPEAMRLEFLMGYDGPFRLWLDGKPFFTDMAGTNPCFPDESSKTAALEAGKHRITVGMDIHHGVAWGFFLRFARKGLKPAQLRAGDFAKPAYGL
jgi:sialate O-acetylesterase